MSHGTETRGSKPSSWPCVCETFPKGNVTRALIIIVALLGRNKAILFFFPPTILNVNSTDCLLSNYWHKCSKNISKATTSLWFCGTVLHGWKLLSLPLWWTEGSQVGKKQNSETHCCGNCVSDYWNFLKGWKPNYCFYFLRHFWTSYNSVSIYYYTCT